MRLTFLWTSRRVLLLYLVLAPIGELFGQKKTLTKQVQFRHDNDVFKFQQVTDQFYSFGLLFNYSTAVRQESLLRRVSMGFGFDRSEKLIFDNKLYLKGFTPEFEADISGKPARPFAGILNWESSAYLSNSNRIWRFGTLLGVRGKISGAEWVQDRFHDWISDKKFEGWRYQLSNKFLFGVNAKYVKPLPIWNWFEVFSESDISMGNYRLFGGKYRHETGKV
jgi:hypothetical protein